MTIHTLRLVYEREHSQAGDTDKNFYEWAIQYLLQKTEHTKSITQIKRHLGDIQKELKKLEENE